MKPSGVFLLAVVRRAGLGLLGLAGLVLGMNARADDVLPLPAPANRYDKLAAHSPFAPPSAGPAPVAPTAPPPPGPTWSDNLTVTSLMQSGAVYTATVIEKDSSARFQVRSDVENPDNHLMLASVRWADKPDAIKVTMRKGTQFGDVHFDPSGTSSASPVPSAPANPLGRPALPNPATNFRPPPPVAQAPLAPPPGMPPNSFVRGRPMIRANPAVPQAPLNRPTVGGPVGAGRAATANKPVKDDDDDDDDN